MARNGQPAMTHRPKDFCTLEQAAYIAQQAIIRHEAAKLRRKWHRRLLRWLKAKVVR